MKAAKKLLALAAPAALILSSAIARADAPAAPAARSATAAAPARATGAAPLAGLAALLRVAAAAASLTPTRPMCGADGRPLAGNMNKGAHACSLDERLASALADAGGPRA